MEKLFFPKEPAKSYRWYPDVEYIHKELMRSRVALKLHAARITRYPLCTPISATTTKGIRVYKKADWYSPVINKTSHEMAEYSVGLAL